MDNWEIHNETAWLTYHFNGMKFEFTNDGILVTDPYTRRKYRLTMTRNSENPFIIQLVEAG